MMADVLQQVATMVVCGLLVTDFVIRLRRGTKTTHTAIAEKPEKTRFENDHSDSQKIRNFKIFACAIVCAYVTVLIRCIYRCVLLTP